jgi:TIGR00275: flavoprotein, HI0933 family
LRGQRREDRLWYPCDRNNDAQRSGFRRAVPQ